MPQPIHRGWFSLAVAFAGGLVLLFVLGPLVGMFLATSPRQLLTTAGDAEVTASIWLTLWTSMGATLILAIVAVPFAYLLARRDFPLKWLVSGIIDIPVVIPHPAAGIALLGVLNRNTALGRLGEAMGLDFVGHPAGIMAAMAFVSLPYLINAARDGFAAVPQRLENAALTLGASPARVFLTISLPLARHAILSGLILMCARGLSEFGAVIIMAYHPMVTPVLIYDRFTSFGLSYAQAPTILFILVCLALLVVLRLLRGGQHAAR